MSLVSEVPLASEISEVPLVSQVPVVSGRGGYLQCLR